MNNPSLCMDGHSGPLLNRQKYIEFMARHPESSMDWTGFGECAQCGSSIHESQILDQKEAA